MRKILPPYPIHPMISFKNNQILLNHLMIAFLAIKFVKKTVVHGATNRPDSTKESFFAMFLVTLWLETEREKIKKGERKDIPETVLLAMTAKFFRVGNCEAQSSHALGYLVMHLKITNAEIFRLKQDHAFLVIGRDPSSDPTDYTTWGENTVICDPWASRYFPASELRDQMTKILIEAKRPPLDPTDSLTFLKIYSEPDTTRSNTIDDTKSFMTYYERHKIYYQYAVFHALNRKKTLPQTTLSSSIKFWSSPLTSYLQYRQMQFGGEKRVVKFFKKPAFTYSSGKTKAIDPWNMGKLWF